MNEARKEYLIMAVAAGKTLAAMGADLGVTRQRAQQLIARLGLIAPRNALRQQQVDECRAERNAARLRALTCPECGVAF